MESKKIQLPPERIWEWYQYYSPELKTGEVIIAENKVFQIGITDQLGCPKLTVYFKENNKKVHEEVCYSSVSLRGSYEGLIDEFLTEPEEPDPPVDREEEIKNSYIEFLKTLLHEDDRVLVDPDSQDFEDIMNEVIDIIGWEGYPVYRPEVIIDNDGNEIITDYPYSYLDDIGESS